MVKLIPTFADSRTSRHQGLRFNPITTPRRFLGGGVSLFVLLLEHIVEHMPVNSPELGLRLFQIFLGDFTGLKAGAKLLRLLFQPGELPVDAAQGPGGGRVRVVIHNITSKYLIGVKEA